MALTVSKLHGIVARRLNYSLTDWPSELSIIDLANQAGDFMVAQREWKWLERPVTSLNVTANQEYVPLPDDISAVISLETSTVGGLGIVAVPTTMIEVVARRLSGNYSRRFWYCVVYADASLSGPPHVPRIELGPTPSESITDAFQLVYRAGWKPVVDTADHIICPRWLERAYIELVVAHAKASEKDYQGSLDQLLAPAVAYLNASAHNDQLIQGELGPWVGGAGYGAALEDLWPDRVERGTISGV